MDTKVLGSCIDELELRHARTLARLALETDTLERERLSLEADQVTLAIRDLLKVCAGEAY